MQQQDHDFPEKERERLAAQALKLALTAGLVLTAWFWIAVPLLDSFFN